MRLSGSAGSESVTRRAVVAVNVSPPGVVSVTCRVSGARMPKRGSAPSTTLVLVPSGVVVVVVPSLASVLVTVSPLGAVTLRRVPPVATRSTP